MDHDLGSTFLFHDGGRALAGFKGHANDCVVRAICILEQKNYREVYDQLNKFCHENKSKDCESSSRTGIQKSLTRKFLVSLGLIWHPLMSIGSGCTVHLRAEELPSGRLIASVSHHLVAVIDGLIYDTHDSTRHGTRCVYGYYQRTSHQREDSKKD